jgi:hypothetical protein
MLSGKSVFKQIRSGLVLGLIFYCYMNYSSEMLYQTEVDLLHKVSAFLKIIT